MDNANRHELLNSIMIIKRLLQFSKPLILKLIEDSKLSTTGKPESLDDLKQSFELLEKEVKKLAEICDTLKNKREV